MLLLVSAAILVPIAVIALLAWKRDDLPGSAETLQSYLTAVAILIAGIWYFTERKANPHADIALEVSGAKINARYALVTAEIRTKNLGDTLLTTSDWDIRLQRLVPPSAPIATIGKLKATDWPETKDGNAIYWDHQIRWESVRQFRGVDRRETEPEEVDVKIVDFLVPCSIVAARVAVSLKKPSSWFGEPAADQGRSDGNGQAPGSVAGPDESIWWQDQAMVSLRNLCRGPDGAVEQLHPLPS